MTPEQSLWLGVALKKHNATLDSPVDDHALVFSMADVLWMQRLLRTQQAEREALQSYFVGCDFADEQHPGHVVLKLACPPHTRVSADLFATIASALNAGLPAEGDQTERTS